MFSTKLNSSQKYIVTSILNNENVFLLDGVFDTGAMYTCYRGDMLGLVEDDVRHNPSKTLRGVVGDSSFTVYKYTVPQYTIGNIDLGCSDIWVTFNEQVSDNVVGMDHISKVCFFQDANTDTLRVSRTKSELEKLAFGGCTLRKVHKDKRGTYIDLDSMRCYFDKRMVARDKNGPYIMIYNNMRKCYLK